MHGEWILDSASVVSKGAIQTAPMDLFYTTVITEGLGRAEQAGR